MIGKSLVIISFILSIASVIFYLFSFHKKSVSLNNIGRWCYYGMTAGVVGISIYLLSNILSHNFQFTYIWEYSSRELYDHFLVATFYAGQQGSFLLWCLTLTLIGYFIIPYLRKNDYEQVAMGIFALIVAFILLILIFKSPFDYVWETYAAQGVKHGFTPENGRGLNPILQNYWITIHPPILFFGFSCMAVPFVIAMAGFFKRDYRGWVNVAMPWALLASGVLGLGLMLGGFWAYETLGWGGFWAWDPVENSSLIPWLFGVTFVHTLLISRRTGGLIKTNYILAGLCFLFVLYSTFLTRSGVLGDTSVHSFVSPGPVVYKFLVIFIIVFVIITFGSFLLKMRQVPTPEKPFLLSSKEFFISIGSVILLLVTFIVTFGTSWPIMAELLGQVKSTVDTKWYNVLNIPLAILFMILNSVALYIKWRGGGFETLARKAFLPTVLSAAAAVVAVSFGIKKIEHAFLIFACTFSIIINGGFLFGSLRKSPKLAGAYLSHAGIALLILGALSSGAYSEKKHIRLKEGESASFDEYKITHLGKKRIESHWRDREKYKYTFAVEKDGDVKYLHPITYWSDFNQRQAPFFEPGIGTYMTQDLYMFPYSLEASYEHKPAILKKEMKAKLSIDTAYQIQLLKFDMSSAMSGGTEGALKIGTLVRLSGPGYVEEDTLYSMLDARTGMNVPLWYNIPGTSYEIGFQQIIPNKENLSLSEAVYVYRNKGAGFKPPVELFTLEVSTKPFITLVWIGTIAIVCGFFLSILKHLGGKRIRKQEADAAEAVRAEEEMVIPDNVVFTKKD